jgi:hypothetical protein
MADADGRKSHRFDQRRLLLAAPGFVAYDPKFLMVICHRHTEIDAQSTDRLTMALTALLKEERHLVRRCFVWIPGSGRFRPGLICRC